MVARHLLFTRQDEAVERIAAHAQSIAGDNPDVVEAVERVREVRGPDEQHIRVFRTEAVADLMELLDDIITGQAADPLEAKTVPQLKGIAKSEGVEGYSSMNKPALIAAINENRESSEGDAGDEDREPAFTSELPEGEFEAEGPGQQPEDGVSPVEADDSDDRPAFAADVDEEETEAIEGAPASPEGPGEVR